MKTAGTTPGIGIGSNQDAKHLFASPELHGLEYRRPRQVDMLIGITHVCA